MQRAEEHRLACAASFEIEGFGLRFEAAADDLLGPVRHLFRRFRAASTPADAWTVRMERVDWHRLPQASPGLQPIWAGDVIPGIRGVNSVGPGRRRIELIDRGRLDVDLRRRKASIRVPLEDLRPCVNYFVMPLLCEALMAAGRCVVHAACLSAPVRGGRRSVMILAESGTGKSTTALALTGAGWQLMGDDITVIRRTADGVRATGFPRECHVRKPTLRLLPWLNALNLAPAEVAGTFNLALEDLGDRACSAVPPALEPALLICLDRPNDSAHRLTPIDRAEALVHVAEENVQPIEGRDDESAKRAFATLADLVQQTPAVRLSAGPQVETLASFLTESLSL
ncbi:MAG: hypothetical protein WCJ18_08335 [Planctomycetota bacterium]